MRKAKDLELALPLVNASTLTIHVAYHHVEQNKTNLRCERRMALAPCNLTSLPLGPQPPVSNVGSSVEGGRGPSASWTSQNAPGRALWGSPLLLALCRVPRTKAKASSACLATPSANLFRSATESTGLSGMNPWIPQREDQHFRAGPGRYKKNAF